MDGLEQPALVSVVLPTFNRAATLERAISSVLQQDYAALELIVVDDGSTDATQAVLAGIPDGRMTVLSMPRNRGQAHARNAGISRARGDLVAFQDSDDEWLPGKLSLQVRALQTAGPEVGVVYCDMLRFYRNGKQEPLLAPTVRRGVIFDERPFLYQSHQLGIQSCLIRHDLLAEAGGFNEELRCLEDLELFLRLAQECDFLRIPQILVHYYETEGVSAQTHWEHEARRYLLRRYGLKLVLAHPRRFAREFLTLWASRRVPANADSKSTFTSQ